MKIVILGAGQVGASVAEALVHEANDITIVDNDRERLAALQDRLDLRTVCGNAALPSILGDAGLDDADLLIAVTQSDQTNLVACKIAKSRFNVPTRIARLRAADFLEDEQLLSDENFAVDFAICPEENITDYIVRLVDFPEALQVLEFAEGRLVMVAVRAYEGGALVGKPVRKLREHLPSQVDARIAALFRQDQPIIPEGETVIHAGDEVFIIAASEHIRPVLRELRRMMRPVKRVMIAGGGNIGYRVATALQQRLEVKLVEHNRSRAEWIAPRLGDTLVLCGDATDEDLLEQENIAEMDLFLALTNDDEDNIMAAPPGQAPGLPAGAGPDQPARLRRHGAGRPHRHRYFPGPGLHRHPAGPRAPGPTSPRSIPCAGAPPRPWNWWPTATAIPPGWWAAAWARFPCPRASPSPPSCATWRRRKSSATRARLASRPTAHVVIAHRDTVIQSGDHVIVFCVNKKLVHKVEKLFQVGFGFL